MQATHPRKQAKLLQMEFFKVLGRSGAKLPCQGIESCFSHVRGLERFFVPSHFLHLHLNEELSMPAF